MLIAYDNRKIFVLFTFSFEGRECMCGFICTRAPGVFRVDARFPSSVPVSYTHLDVYKRQELWNSGCHSVRGGTAEQVVDPFKGV